MPGRGEIVLQPIHVDDLVNALAVCLQRLQLVDTLVEIGGPEYFSLRDLLRTVMRVWRMPRYVISVPPWAVATHGGALQPAAAARHVDAAAA